MKKEYAWYDSQKKPAWAPPRWLFGPVWTLLYALIAVSFGTVGYQAFHHTLPSMIAALCVLNLVFNLAYSPIEFRLHNHLLAMIDCFLILGTLLAALIAVHAYAPWVAYINIPYLLWVSFATCLQTTIWWMNRSRI